MQLSTLLFCLLVFLLSSVRPRHHKPRVARSANQDIYHKLQARVVPVGSSPTAHVLRSRKVSPATRTLRKRGNSAALRDSVVLKQLLQTVDDEGAKVKSYAGSASSPDTIVSQVKQPTQNILEASQQALGEVKNAESAPAPSSVVDSTSTTPCPLILSIIRCLKNLLSALLNSMDPSYVHANLGDTLTQITGTLSQIIREVGSQVPGAINDIIQTGGDVLDSIKSLGFGFGDILDVLKPQ